MTTTLMYIFSTSYKFIIDIQYWCNVIVHRLAVNVRATLEFFWPKNFWVSVGKTAWSNINWFLKKKWSFGNNIVQDVTKCFHQEANNKDVTLCIYWRLMLISHWSVNIDRYSIKCANIHYVILAKIFLYDVTCCCTQYCLYIGLATHCFVNYSTYFRETVMVQHWLVLLKLNKMFQSVSVH